MRRKLMTSTGRKFRIWLKKQRRGDLPTISKIHKELRMSQETVIKYLKILEEEKKVKIHRDLIRNRICGVEKI